MASEGRIPAKEFTVVDNAHVMTLNPDGSSETFFNDPYRAKRYRGLFNKYLEEVDGTPKGLMKLFSSLKERLSKYIK